MPTLAIESRSWRFRTRRPGFLARTLSTSFWKTREGAHVELAGQGHLGDVAVELGVHLERIDRRDDADPDLVPLLVVGNVDGQLVGVEVGVRLAVDPDLADPDAARRQDVRRDAQDVVLEAARLRLEVEVHRLLGDQQVGVDRRQVAQLDRVVAGSSSGCPCSRSVPSRYGMPLASTLK